MHAIIETSFVTLALILARVSAFLALAPVLGGRAVPKLVKLSLALALSSFWFTSSGAAQAQAVFSVNQSPWLGLILAVARESIIGAVLGYTFSLFLVPFRIAGEYVAQEMGLTLGSITDPTQARPSTVMGEFFELVGTLLFLSQNVHHLFLALLHQTFALQPLGGSYLPVPPGRQLQALASVTEWGLLLAAPVGCVMFLTSLLLALLTRAAPQLNLMSAGFALRVLVGMLAMLTLWPELVPWMLSVLHRSSSLLKGG
ncbi:MAG: flagellar biosynthetic protein FliR [Planctomycetia bacterium]|nr:flagellar biosynthetic protein FliR [Planctomycetia bacterium]